ncbi:MAG: substrate-binding domain-containing protein [Fimbriimonadaceae bacterium]|nr:substrate-binding domain-containing protein [Fimbriimonadaceae bacterium]
MKVNFAWFAAASLAVALAGCNAPEAPKTEPGAKAPDATASTGKKYKIGVSIPAADHGWTSGVVYWANQAKKDLAADADVTVVTAKGPEEQVKQLETLATQGMDAIVFLATETDPVTPAVKKLKDQGIFLVSVDRGVKTPVDIFLQGDNKEFGKISAEYIVKKLGGKGKILVYRGIPSTVDTDRVDAANAVFKANPGIEVLAELPGKWDRQEAYKVTQTALLKFPQIDAIWASDDDMALGIEKALKEANRANIWMLGGAGMKDVVKRIMDKDPAIPADTTYPPKMIYQGVDECVKALKAGTKPGGAEQKVTIKCELITPENADQFYYPDSPF